jgi:hypothetical protein
MYFKSHSGFGPAGHQLPNGVARSRMVQPVLGVHAMPPGFSSSEQHRHLLAQHIALVDKGIAMQQTCRAQLQQIVCSQIALRGSITNEQHLQPDGNSSDKTTVSAHQSGYDSPSVTPWRVLVSALQQMRLVEPHRYKECPNMEL